MNEDWNLLCSKCGRKSWGSELHDGSALGDVCKFLQPDNTICSGIFIKGAPKQLSRLREHITSVPIKPPMTQEECENWILLKSQTGDAVFEIHLVDKEVDQDPTMRALMETITDMIHQGIMGMPFEESQQAGKPDLEVVKP